MSLLCAENPGLADLLADAGIRLLWHPALSVETGAEARSLLERIERGEVPLDILCVEGAIAREPRGTGRYGHLMQAALAEAPGPHAARDCTRGGLASALNEMAGEAGLSVEIDETALPLRDEVRGVCEILGLDPLYLANEGRLVLFCPADQAEAALAAMRALPEGAGAVVTGRAMAGPAGRVTMRTAFGGARIVDMLVGEQLPRIC